MKKILVLIFTLTPLIFYGQAGKAGKLKKEINIDTLFVFLEFTDTTDQILKNELKIQFDKIVSKFNRQEEGFILVVDSSQIHQSIRFLVGPIKYVDWKKNLWVTGLDLALIGANILILPYFPPVIPFYLMPATYSRVDIKSADEIFYKPAHFFVNPNGYFTKKEKQKMRFKRKFDKKFYKYFCNLNSQNQKNNRTE